MAESQETEISTVLNAEPGEAKENSLNDEEVKESSVKRSQRKVQRQAVSKIYRQDVVKHPCEDDVYGLVTRVAGDSDSDSDEEEDEEDDDSLQGDEANVIWSHLSETKEKIEVLEVADRGFMQGDIVAPISDPKGQTGTVVNVDLNVDLKLPSDEIKPNVPSKKLKRIRAFVEGDHVLQGAWLGRVVEVMDNVTVLFDDGSKCKVIDADPERLVPLSNNQPENSMHAYCPGEQVRAASSTVLKTGKWLRGTWRAGKMEGTICDLEAGSVYVYWMVAASPGSLSKSVEVPSDLQSSRDLKLVSSSSNNNWQLGDWCVYPTVQKTISTSTSGKQEVSLERNYDIPIDNETDIVNESADNEVPSVSELGEDFVPPLETNLTFSSEIKSSTCNVPSSDTSIPTVSGAKSSIQESWILHRKKYRKRKVKREKKLYKKGDFLERACFIVKTNTFVDVLWQDGTVSRGIEGKTLFHVENLGEHDFWPDQYVCQRIQDVDGEGGEQSSVGVVKSVNAQERTAIVRWLKPLLQPEDVKEFEREEEVSVYELIEHPDYNYCLGDIVVRLSPVTGHLEAYCSDKQVMESKQNQPVNQPKSEDPCNTDNTLTSEKSCEMDSKEDISVRTEGTSTDQRFTRKKQKTKPGTNLESNPSDINEGKTTEPFYLQGSSKRRSKYMKAMHIDQSDLSSIGSIIGLKDGDIEVMWANGTTSKVGPQTIYVVGRDDDTDSTESSVSDNDDYDDAASWETVDDVENEDSGNEEEREETAESSVKGTATDKDIESKESLEGRTDSSGNETVSLPRVALGFVARLATSLLAFGTSKTSASTVEDSNENQSSDKSEALDSPVGTDKNDIEKTRTLESPKDDNLEDSISMESSGGELFAVLAHKDDSQTMESTTVVPDVACKDDLNSFKHFDSIKDPHDHHFVNETAQNFNDRKWLRKVQQEWNLLEKNLPDTIYVRVYEDRMDLLRAVIIGAAGTPYQDGMFFFDICLPADYPQTPPAVHYHSHGLRLNPNLYENGKVCLSLLNTWTGKGNEVWEPKQSTILQVLVSLQGLVLNSRPYFNEAGYDRQVGSAEGEKNSLAYNENSFLLSCKSMFYLLKKPPQHFEGFVMDHFRRRHMSILEMCEAYMKGAEVGSLSGESFVADSPTQRSSAGFRLMLAKIVPKLQSAFDEIR